MTELVYSRTRHPLIAGREYRNPRFFSEPEKGVKKVYVVGGASTPAMKQLADTYERAGVEVIRVDDLGQDEVRKLIKRTGDAETEARRGVVHGGDGTAGRMPTGKVDPSTKAE